MKQAVKRRAPRVKTPSTPDHNQIKLAETVLLFGSKRAPVSLRRAAEAVLLTELRRTPVISAITCAGVYTGNGFGAYAPSEAR